MEWPFSRASGAGATRLLVYGVSVAMLVMLAVLAGKEGFARLSNPHWGYLAISFLMTHGFMDAMARRYAAVLRCVHSGPQPPFLSVLYSTVLGMTAGLVVTKGVGQVVAKPAVLKEKEGFPLTEGVYGSFLERILDLAQAVALTVPFFLKLFLDSEPFPGFFLLSFVVLSLLMSGGIAAGFSACVGRLGRLVGKAGEWFGRLPWARVRRLGDHLSRSASQVLPRDYAARDVAGFVFWSLAKLYIISGRMVFLGLAFSAPISWECFLLGVPVAQLSMLFAFTPGSVGFLEAGWLAVLAAQGVASETVLTVLLGLRVTNFVFFPLILHLVGLAYRGRSRCRKPPPGSDGKARSDAQPCREEKIG